MALTNCESLGHGDASRLADPLLLLQKVNTWEPTTSTELEAAHAAFHAPDRAPWKHELDRLQGLEDELALLPVGWGSDGKAPMLAGWPDHPGFTVRELQGIRSIRSVGARTGLLTGPLLCFDFDGESSLHLGLDPSSVGSWQVHRDNDQHRLKVLFRPTLEQLSRLPDGEFQGKTITAPAADGRKGEALEVFFHGRRQVIVLGDHPSSGGRYVWPRGKGPEALTAPPEAWWAHALEIAAGCRQGSLRPRSNRHNTRRLNPCPICGRHDGPGGSALWCDETRDGRILCMPGTTFNAEQRHGPLRIGQVVDGGWALVKRSPIAEGDVLTFKIHRPRGVNHG